MIDRLGPSPLAKQARARVDIHRAPCIQASTWGTAHIPSARPRMAVAWEGGAHTGSARARKRGRELDVSLAHEKLPTPARYMHLRDRYE